MNSKSSMLNKFFFFFFFVAVCTALIAPDMANARAGGGRSVGSRGSNTYQSSPSAQPISRSVTAPSTLPGASSQPSGQPYNGDKSSFLSGIAGGFLGAGLFHMFFGGNSYGGNGIAGSGMGVFELILLGGAGLPL